MGERPMLIRKNELNLWHPRPHAETTSSTVSWEPEDPREIDARLACETPDNEELRRRAEQHPPDAFWWNEDEDPFTAD